MIWSLLQKDGMKISNCFVKFKTHNSTIPKINFFLVFIFFALFCSQCMAATPQKIDIPIGMMWVQTSPLPVDTPRNAPRYKQKFVDELKIIKNPVLSVNIVACDRVVREDIWEKDDTIETVMFLPISVQKDESNV